MFVIQQGCIQMRLVTVWVMYAALRLRSALVSRTMRAPPCRGKASTTNRRRTMERKRYVALITVIALFSAMCACEAITRNAHSATPHHASDDRGNGRERSSRDATEDIAQPEQFLYAAIGWSDEYLREPAFQDFPAVEFAATIHPTTTAQRFGPGLPFGHHLPPSLEWVESRTQHIPAGYNGLIYIDAEPWRSRYPDGSQYLWRWVEMYDYYETLVGHFRELYPDALLILHGLPTVPIHYAPGQSKKIEKFVPILELVDYVGPAMYSSNAGHASTGGLSHLKKRLNRAEELARLTGQHVICIHSRRIAGDHADHPDAVDGQLYWTDAALRARRDLIRSRGFGLMLWSGQPDETTLHALSIFNEVN
jgi:hypothetical protein